MQGPHTGHDIQAELQGAANYLGANIGRHDEPTARVAGALHVFHIQYRAGADHQIGQPTVRQCGDAGEGIG